MERIEQLDLVELTAITITVENTLLRCKQMTQMEWWLYLKLCRIVNRSPDETLNAYIRPTTNPGDEDRGNDQLTLFDLS